MQAHNPSHLLLLPQILESEVQGACMGQLGKHTAHGWDFSFQPLVGLLSKL